MKKFRITIEIERSEPGDYPLSDANQVLLSIAEQFAALTKRHDTLVPLPVRMKLNDPELGFSGTVTAGMSEVELQPDKSKPKALRLLTGKELSALALARAKKRSMRD